MNLNSQSLTTKLLLPQNKQFKYGMWMLVMSCLPMGCARFLFAGYSAVIIIILLAFAGVLATVMVIIGFTLGINEWKMGRINPFRWQVGVCCFVVISLFLFLNLRSTEWKLIDHPNLIMDSKDFPGYRTVSRGWPFPYSTTIYGLADAGTRPYSQRAQGVECFLIADLLIGFATILLALYLLQLWTVNSVSPPKKT